MTQKARVISVDGSYAVVRVSRKTICEGCHNTDSSCSACFAFGDKNAECRALNSIGASVGDTVTVMTESSRIIGYAALVFIAPIVIALALYMITSALKSANPALWAMAGFVLPFGLFCFILDRKIKKSPDTVIISVETEDTNKTINSEEKK